MPTFEINNALYHYVDQGSGKSLLLLHGFMGSVKSWGEINLMLQQNYRVIAVDILGHGQSSNPPTLSRYHIEEAANDLAMLLAAIQAAPTHIIGYSMGARLALYFALTYPHFVSKLVLESGSPGLATRGEQDGRIKNDNQLAKYMLEEGLTAFVEYWERLPLFESQSRLSDEILAKQREQRLTNHVSGLANSLQGMGTGSQPSLWGKLGALNSPTLLITGEFDNKYCDIAERMAQMMPSATLQIMPDAGHNVHLEQPARYLQIIESFLQG